MEQLHDSFVAREFSSRASISKLPSSFKRKITLWSLDTESSGVQRIVDQPVNCTNNGEFTIGRQLAERGVGRGWRKQPVGGPRPYEYAWPPSLTTSFLIRSSCGRRPNRCHFSTRSTFNRVRRLGLTWAANYQIGLLEETSPSKLFPPRFSRPIVSNASVAVTWL